jgi:valyl-tRNA synthetase
MWANADDFAVDDHSAVGKVMLDTIAEVRKYKSDKNISIKEIIEKITVHSDVDIKGIVEDLKNVCNVGAIEVVKGEFGVDI